MLVDVALFWNLIPCAFKNYIFRRPALCAYPYKLFSARQLYCNVDIRDSSRFPNAVSSSPTPLPPTLWISNSHLHSNMDITAGRVSHTHLKLRARTSGWRTDAFWSLTKAYRRGSSSLQHRKHTQHTLDTRRHTCVCIVLHIWVHETYSTKKRMYDESPLHPKKEKGQPVKIKIL